MTEVRCIFCGAPAQSGVYCTQCAASGPGTSQPNPTPDLQAGRMTGIATEIKAARDWILDPIDTDESGPQWGDDDAGRYPSGGNAEPPRAGLTQALPLWERSVDGVGASSGVWDAEERQALVNLCLGLGAQDDGPEAKSAREANGGSEAPERPSPTSESLRREHPPVPSPNESPPPDIGADRGSSSLLGAVAELAVGLIASFLDSRETAHPVHARQSADEISAPSTTGVSDPTADRTHTVPLCMLCSSGEARQGLYCTACALQIADTESSRDDSSERREFRRFVVDTIMTGNEGTEHPLRCLLDSEGKPYSARDLYAFEHPIFDAGHVVSHHGGGRAMGVEWPADNRLDGTHSERKGVVMEKVFVDVEGVPVELSLLESLESAGLVPEGTVLASSRSKGWTSSA